MHRYLVLIIFIFTFDKVATPGQLQQKIQGIRSNAPKNPISFEDRTWLTIIIT